MGGSGVLRSCSSRSFSLGALLPLQWIHLAAVLLLSYLLGASWCWCSTLLAVTVAGHPGYCRLLVTTPHLFHTVPLQQYHNQHPHPCGFLYAGTGFGGGSECEHLHQTKLN